MSSAAQGHDRCPECWGENGEHLFNCSKFYDPRPGDAAQNHAETQPPEFWECVDDSTGIPRWMVQIPGPIRNERWFSAREEAFAFMDGYAKGVHDANE